MSAVTPHVERAILSEALVVVAYRFNLSKIFKVSCQFCSYNSKMAELSVIAGYIVILQPQKLAQEIPKLPFFLGENTIGRNQKKARIVIAEGSISSLHAKLKVTHHHMTIADCSSTNGIRINSKESNLLYNLNEVAIDQQMVIYLGDVKCRFQRIEHQEQALPSSKASNRQHQQILKLLDDSEEQANQLKIQTKQQKDESKENNTKGKEETNSFSICHENVNKGIKKSKESKGKKNEERPQEQATRSPQRGKSKQIQQTKHDKNLPAQCNKSIEKQAIKSKEKLGKEKEKLSLQKGKEEGRKKEKPPKGKEQQIKAKHKQKEITKQTDVQRHSSKERSVSLELKRQKSVSQRQKTKPRPQNRKRLPSQLMKIEQQISPQISIRRSYVNKRIMASGLILALTKKYFCVVQSIEDEFDYLVMKEYKRTFKALYAISKGLPIVRYDWVKESQFFKRTLKPENYYFKELEEVYNAIQRVKEGFRVFKDYHFYLASSEYHIRTEDIETLIYTCGGEIMKKMGKLSGKEKEGNNKIAIIRNKEEESKEAYEQQVKRARKVGFELIYSIQMVLDSVQRQEIDWGRNEVRSK